MRENQQSAPSAWQTEMEASFHDVDTLLGFLKLNPGSCPYRLLRQPSQPFSVTADFARRMGQSDWFDPLLLQVLPRNEESDTVPGFSEDPVADQSALAAPGLIHKYPGRVLLMVHSGCAQYCRYCFRRAGSAAFIPRDGVEWAPAWAYISGNKDISEVILSGGDPLMLETAELRYIIDKISEIKHVHVLRIHSRMPVVLPSRVDTDLISTLKKWQSKNRRAVLVLQINHPREIAGGVLEAVRGLREAGIQLLNQCVLLKDINDSAGVQVMLARTLSWYGILPYYCHQLDRAQGAAHFEVSTDEGRRIFKEVRRCLPGYMAPRYVQDIPGEASKTLLV